MKPSTVCFYNVLLGREPDEASSCSLFSPELTRGWMWPYGGALLLCKLRSCCLATWWRCFSTSFCFCRVWTFSWSSSSISSISRSLTLDTGWPLPATSCSKRLRSFTIFINFVPSLKPQEKWRNVSFRPKKENQFWQIFINKNLLT